MTESTPKKALAGKPDALTETSKAAPVELTEAELETVTGGDARLETAAQANVTNTMKAAHKGAASFDDYLNG